MADQYLGDNLIPGVNVKNINAGIINPLMQLGGQIGTAYDQYGKGLRSALGQDQEEFAQQFLAGKLPDQKGLKEIVQVTLKDGKEQSFDLSTKDGAAAMNKAIDAQQVVQAPEITETSLPPSEPANGAARLDPNATKDYKAAFEGGQKNKDAIQQMYADRPDLQQWAEKNPALAFKEFKKAGLAGKEPFGYNDVEFGKLKENPTEAAKRAGIEKLYDGQVEQTEQEKAAQVFRNYAVETMKGLNIGQYKDLGANPFSIDPSALLEKSVDFNIPGLAGTLGNYGTADYGELLKQYPNIFSNK